VIGPLPPQADMLEVFIQSSRSPLTSREGLAITGDGMIGRKGHLKGCGHMSRGRKLF
jgi:hypothetical protein